MKILETLKIHRIYLELYVKFKKISEFSKNYIFFRTLPEASLIRKSLPGRLHIGGRLEMSAAEKAPFYDFYIYDFTIFSFSRLFSERYHFSQIAEFQMPISPPAQHLRILFLVRWKIYSVSFIIPKIECVGVVWAEIWAFEIQRFVRNGTCPFPVFSFFVYIFVNKGYSISKKCGVPRMRIESQFYLYMEKRTRREWPTLTL